MVINTTSFSGKAFSDSPYRTCFLFPAPYFCYSALLCVVCITALAISGQDKRSNSDGFTPSALTPGMPDVNPYNGSLNFTLPLAEVRGRGDAGYTIALPIEQHWEIERSTYPGGELYTPVYKWFQSYKYHGYDPYHASFASIPPRTYLPGFLKGRKVGDLMSCGGNFGDTYGNTYTNLIFTTANGSEIDMRDELTQGQVGNPPCGSSEGISRGTIFSSYDGSAMTFISDAEINDVGNSGYEEFFPSGLLLLADGSRYRVDNGHITWMKDRNGNLLIFTYETLQPYLYKRLTSVTDSLNRVVTISYLQNEDQITYRGTGGAARTIRILRSNLGNILRSGESLRSFGSLFPELSFSGRNVSFNPVLISAVILPNNQSYQFRYNSYGELARVEFPTGGAAEYDWAAGAVGTPASGSIEHYGVYRRVIESRVSVDGFSVESRRTFSQPQTRTSPGMYNNAGYVQIENFDVYGQRLAASKHYFYGDPVYSLYPTYDRWKPWKDGREYQTEMLDTDGASVITRQVHTWSQRPPASEHPEAAAFDPRITRTVTTLVDTNQVSMKEFSYDSFNNETDRYEYDYGDGAPGSFVRRTHTDYVNDVNYVSNTGSYLRRLPLQTWVSSDINGDSKVSLTQFEYDDYSPDESHSALVPRSNVAGHDATSYGTNNVRRGNLTAVTSYANAQAQTGAVSTYSQYDVLGSVVMTIDANGNVSTVNYNDNFGAPDGEATTNTSPFQLDGLNTFALPTSTTNPMGWTSRVQYDYFTSSPVNAQDVNGLISKTIYNDLLDRPTHMVSAIGTPNEIQSSVSYNDPLRKVSTTSDLFVLNDNLAKTESFYDGLGRTVEKRSYKDGDYVSVKTDYDALGRVGKVTNPFRPLRSEAELWTKTKYDALGRVLEVETPDMAKMKTSYDGNRVLVTDQVGKQRMSRTNALGQLKDVWEITPTDQWTEAVSFPSQTLSAGYRTSYNYDTLGNLLTVNQGVQTRTFGYDNLSRLLSATNPESGIITYTYDPNGNLKTRRDARNIKTVYDYDALNRIKKRCYRSIGTGGLGMRTCTDNTETPELNTTDVTYTYENATVTNLKGVLTKVTNGFSTTEYIAFDLIGRVTRSKQTTDGVEYGGGTDPTRWMTYAYNLSGALVEQQYPSGRVVKNAFDTDGDLSLVRSKRNASYGFFKYAGAFSYNAAGAVTSMQLGNGRWESTIFNFRLQPTEIALGTIQNGHDHLRLQYSYGDWNGDTIDSTKNNGNVVRQIITVPTVGTIAGFTATQKYYYDSLNRIDDSTEEITGQTWRQDFTYDRYGNRNFMEANTTALPKNCNGGAEVCPNDRLFVNPSVNTANNRLSTSDGYDFDAAGNLSADAAANNFEYDGENKQIRITNSVDVIGQYWYDGAGKRIKKYVPATGEITIFVYDAVGKQIAEYSTVVQTGSNAKATYTTGDRLGSPRVNTDGFGSVIARHDYQPFGEEIATPQRTSGAGYVSDTIRKKFTGYERDGESELDFAQARYYASIHGRFTTPDPLPSSATVGNPQSFNRYAYVENSPLRFVDPSGMLLIETDFVDYDTGKVTPIDDGKDQVITARGKTIEAFKRLWDAGQGSPAARRLYDESLRGYENSWHNLRLTVDQFRLLARTVYQESSGGYRESYGIVNVLENRAAVDIALGKITEFMDEVSNAPGFGIRGVNSTKYDTEQGAAADQKRLNVNKAIARAIPGNDITGGAFFWDGRDFNKNARGNNSGWQLRHQSGYFFTKPSHDLYNQGSYRHPTRGYYYESTNAIEATTFTRRYNYQGGNWR